MISSQKRPISLVLNTWGLAALMILAGLSAPVRADFYRICLRTWPKVVKVFGAGGLRRLQSYSSGIIVSPYGHILTVWNHVLETPHLRVVLSDGRRFDAKLQLVDTEVEAAIIKIEVDEGLPYFDIERAAKGRLGEWVLAFSNAYRIAQGSEKPSVVHGIVSAITELKARRGVFEAKYQGPVYVLDGITNNPGAGGGAVTNGKGMLIGMIGKELRSTLTNTWLNFAVPAHVLAPFVKKGLAGETFIPSSSAAAAPRAKSKKGPVPKHGIVLVPDVLRQTPAYVDAVEPGSPGQSAGVRPDDLVLFIEDEFIGTVKAFNKAIRQYLPGQKVRLLLRRGEELVMLEMTLK